MGEAKVVRVTAGRSAPLVGVLIPAYQAAAYLPDTLRSLQAQTLTNWCGVVVDDGSTDGTGAIADAFATKDPRLVVIHQRNAGEGAARNTAITHLPPECEYVGFLDSDDLYLPHALETLVSALRARPDAAGVSGLAEYIDSAGRPIEAGLHPSRLRHRLTYQGLRRRMLDPAEDATYDSLLVLGTIWPPAVALLRREVITVTGGFDTTLKTLADWDFFLRASRCGPIAMVPIDIVRYRRHPGNASRDNALYVRNTCIVQRKAWSRAGSFSERLAVIRAQAHFLGWIVSRNLALGRTSLTAGDLSATAVAAGWLTLAVSMAVLGPGASVSRHLLDGLISREDPVRGRAFLNEGP